MFKWRKIEELKNECDTYAESFHKIELYLIQVLQYHERMKELQKALETTNQLVQQQFDEKRHESQDDPDRCSKYKLVKQCKILKILIINVIYRRNRYI